MPRFFLRRSRRPPFVEESLRATLIIANGSKFNRGRRPREVPMELKIEIGGVKLGLVEADGVQVGLSNPGLLQALVEVCARLAQELPSAEAVARLDSIRGVRD